jgi:hypothetical protein
LIESTALGTEHGSNITPLTKEAGCSETLTIVPWDPSQQLDKPRKTGARQWKKFADKLIDLTPKAMQWWPQMEMMGLYQIMETGAAAQFVLGGSSATVTDRQPGAVFTLPGFEEHSLINAVKAYAEGAANRTMTAQCMMSLVNLQKIVLLSTCSVLAELGVSTEALITVTRICFGGVGDQYAVRLWRTGKYINQLVDGLGYRDWGHRASELLLICRSIFSMLGRLCLTFFTGNLTPVSYLSLAWSPEDSMEYMISHLSSGVYTQNVEPRKGWTSLFIPGLVCQVLGRKLRYLT